MKRYQVHFAGKEEAVLEATERSVGSHDELETSYQSDAESLYDFIKDHLPMGTATRLKQIMGERLP